MDNNCNVKLKIRLFPYIEDINKMKKLKIDKDSIYYISIREDADIITNIIKNLFIKNDIYVTDATAGVGGNTISFAQNFKHINSIEINKIRYSYLLNNINIYNINNVNTYHANCLDILCKLYSDVIFFDPPWGGPTYKNKKNIRLKLTNLYIEDICKNIFNDNLTKYIVMKLPLNYNLSIFNKNFNIELHKLNKMLIIVVHKIVDMHCL
jgi:16S rRNA G966 N2-methylase RsmD